MDEVDNVDLAGVEVEGRGATFKRVDKLMSCSILFSIYLTKFGFLKSLSFGNLENGQKYTPLQLWTYSVIFLTFLNHLG